MKEKWDSKDRKKTDRLTGGGTKSPLLVLTAEMDALRSESFTKVRHPPRLLRFPMETAIENQDNAYRDSWKVLQAGILLGKETRHSLLVPRKKLSEPGRW